MLSCAAKTPFSQLQTQCHVCSGKSCLNARDRRQPRITGPAFPFSLFQASLIYKEFKTHVKISIQRLNYFLDGELTFLLFFCS